MMTLEAVRLALADRRMKAVALKTGLHENTIRAIRDGHTVNPGWHAMKKLSDYLQEVPTDAAS